MGSLLSEEKKHKILLIGLDGSGKTFILYKWTMPQPNTIPSPGFNVEHITHKDTHLQIWDVGGNDKIRPLWPHYYNGLEGIIYVVDSTDKERIQLAGVELEKVLKNPEVGDVVLLVLANKQDHPQAMSTKEVAEKLGLYTLTSTFWSILPTSAQNEVGLIEGLDWLVNALTLKQQ